MVPSVSTLLLILLVGAVAAVSTWQQASKVRRKLVEQADQVSAVNNELRQRQSELETEVQAGSEERATLGSDLDAAQLALARERRKVTELTAKLEAETVRRVALDSALREFHESADLPPAPSVEEYLKELRASGFSHVGPMIEFRPAEVGVSPTEALPPVLLVRLPIAGESNDHLEQLVRLAIRRGADLAPGRPSVGLGTDVRWSEAETAVSVRNFNHIGPLLYGIPSYGETLVLWTVNEREMCSTGCRTASQFGACSCQCGGMYHGRSDGTPWPGWTDVGYRRSYTDGRKEKAALLEPEWWKKGEPPPLAIGSASPSSGGE